jgi:hypothetical protein
MRFHGLLMMAGLAVAGMAGVAAADPGCDPSSQPVVVSPDGYDGYDGYTNTTYNEPAPGTYQNGYVWVAGAYEYVGNTSVWVPAHWQAAPQPVYQAPVVYAPRVIVHEPRFMRRDYARAYWRHTPREYARGGRWRPYHRR